jgi:hypothetical protein
LIGIGCGLILRFIGGDFCNCGCCSCGFKELLAACKGASAGCCVRHNQAMTAVKSLVTTNTNQFFVVAIAEKISAMKTADFFS